MEDLDLENLEDERQLEKIRGEGIKKPKMNILNQKRLSKWEMDELFLDEQEDHYDEEF
ncbi:MAG: hypothetical protein ACLFN8_03795 [Candidatus Woesearchaeota archaeon]